MNREQLVSMILSAGLLLAVPGSGIASEATQEEPAISFSWFDCDSAHRPYFIIDAWSGGRVRYRGLHEVRTLGEVKLAVPSSKIKNLLHIAERFERVRKKKPIHASGNARGDKPNSRYCLSVTRVARGKAFLTLSNFGADAAIQFNTSAKKAIEFQRYVCPGAAFHFYGYPGACDVADVSMIYDESGECRVRHVVHVYRRGLIHYHVADVPESDKFVDIGVDAAEGLAQVARTYTIVGAEGIEGSEWPLYGTDVELQDFRKRIASAASVEFATIQSNDPRCLKQLTPTQIQREITF